MWFLNTFILVDKTDCALFSLGRLCYLRQDVNAYIRISRYTFPSFCYDVYFLVKNILICCFYNVEKIRSSMGIHFLGKKRIFLHTSNVSSASDSLVPGLDRAMHFRDLPGISTLKAQRSVITRKASLYDVSCVNTHLKKCSGNRSIFHSLK